MCTKPILTLKIGDKIINPKLIPEDKRLYDLQKSENIIAIPCGKCEECKKLKMFEMQKRLRKELEIRKKAFFLTLTYDEMHKKELNKKDIQLFLKRYRKKEKLRYFYVGELGETTKRPHYHAIIFADLPKDLKESNTTTKNGYKQYESNTISKIWGKGIIKICKMQKPLINYITKYMLKNANKKEFICDWSRKPPIGIDPDKVEEEILKPKRTKALKKYYKYRYKKIPILENEIEKSKIKIEQIEKQTKLKYIDYLKKKVE